MPEFLPPGTSPQQSADQLNLFLSTLFGGKSPKIRWGNDVVTWPGGANASNLTTVTHGLGNTPVQVLVAMRGGAHFCALEAPDGNWTSTSFKVDAYSVDGVPTVGQQTRFSWIALG